MAGPDLQHPRRGPHRCLRQHHQGSQPGGSGDGQADPRPTNTLSGPVGTVYKVTDDSGNVMTVKLTQMIDPAQGADQYTTPDNGFRFVAAVFTLNGVSGTFSDDANSDATLIGSNSQTYTFDGSSLAGR